ncbi:hydrogenase [candidate division WOR-1 bacterium DG_54_3]|uniref:Hydrogenase n=1 Tax=candidate division WOR-1 bacterium DG_54_3 TaxID=1703775 RepID=A0A0S7XSK3_UNCSA|nr:MAG: hydrogenase [candidate division WOR-1 bacterium DG_54_3]
MKKIKSIKELDEIKESLAKQRASEKPCVVISSGTCGQARGSDKVVEAFLQKIQSNGFKDKVTMRVTGCHGFCEVEPTVLIYPEEILYQKVKPEDAGQILSETIINQRIIDRLLYSDPVTKQKSVHEEEIPFYQKQNRLVMGNNRFVDPTKIEDYLAIGGYSAFRKVLSGMTADQVIEEIKKSGLRGRGGGGFPTGFKWAFCRKAKGETKYIICNADEGDPGAYMDRSLLEGNPHSVLEGMLIGAFAIGAKEGFIYVRNEYPLAVKNVTIAINQAREYGLLGKDILGSGFDFDLKIIRGAGAFVCGEETALIASIEGRSGEPRQRPPYPVQKGLWGKPTNINNVETWANVPLAINRGAEWYSKIGTEKSKGTKIFSLVGKINNTGLVEVPMGITLREIIEDIGGGIPKGKKFKAVQTGGPSGGCMPTKLLDLPVDYERLTEVGSMMGSGGMVVMDEDTCMVDVAKYFLNFLKDESCGKCFMCREGILRMLEIVTDITEGRGKPEDIDLLEELANTVKDSTMCGLGQTAPNPVLSTLKYFRDEYEAHVKYKRCPAVVCKEIISSPCQHTCPVGQEACVYIALIAKGEFEKALEIIRKDNPLPSVCARVCHHPCELKCRAGESGDPIAIRALKRFATDYGFTHRIGPNVRFQKTKKEKVAIIGSGPAGLTCGFYLAQKGYEVAILEALPVPGGMLAVGIPEHRLPKKILNADIEAIKNAGVTIKTNQALGKDFSLEDLFKKGYKAVFISTGAHKSWKLGIPGEEGEGVLESMQFLTAVNLGKEIKIGKRVGIIGGGNAAVDSARVANRLKDCEKVTIIYRRTKAEMPAFKEEVESALEEGIDVQFLAAPIRVLRKNGKLVGIECIRMELGEPDESGRRRPVPIKGSEFEIGLDTLIPAIGEQPDLFFLEEHHGVNVSKRGTIVVDPETFATDKEGIFAGGDVVTGANTVVEAMAAGKVASQSIDKYLKGESLVRIYQVTKPSVLVEAVELTEEELAELKRPEMPVLSIEQRRKNFKEVELGFDEKRAIKEARRCLRCELESEEIE